MFANFVLELLAIIASLAPNLATEIQAVHNSANGAGKVNAAVQGLAHISTALLPLASPAVIGAHAVALTPPLVAAPAAKTTA